MLRDNNTVTMTEDFLSGPREYPSAITVAEIRDRFIAAGLPCWLEHHDGEVWIVFENRQSNLIFTVNAGGRPLTAIMPEAMDYDTDFACVVFDVFDSMGWSYDQS